MMLIEPLASEDLPAIMRIEQDAQVYPWTENVFSGCLTTQYHNVKLLNEDNIIVGFYIAQSIAGQMELFNLCVASTEQGKGYGHLLLQHFIAKAVLLGSVELLLEVRASNKAAIALYHKVGFSQTAVRKGYYANEAGKEDALLMTLILS